MTPFERLDYLATLQDGWMGAGYGKAMNSTKIELARTFFNVLGDKLDALNPPGIFPSEDGDIIIEWFFSDGIWAVDLESDGDYVAIYDHTVDVDDPRSVQEIETSNPQEMVDFLVQHFTKHHKE